jgi:hypothetical protein
VSRSEKQIEKLNNFLKSWSGSDAHINSYIEGHNRLIIVLKRPEDATIHIAIAFVYCFFISGPTRWSNVNLVVCGIELDGTAGLEVRDSSNDFVVRCGGIVVGNNEIVVPRT